MKILTPEHDTADRPAVPVANGRARPLSILHVAAPAPFGGLETVLLSLSAGQMARGHRVHVAAVLTPGETRHPFVEGLRERGVATSILHIPTRGYLEERRCVEEIARSIDADILHTHGYRPDVITSGVAGRLGIPRVSTVHGFCAGSWKGHLYEWLQVRSYRRFDGVVAVAATQLERLHGAGVPPDRVHLLPNAWTPAGMMDPVDARAVLGASPDAFHIGWVGRLSREKGADVFLEALAELGDVPFCASIIGDGPERPQLETRAAELGVSDRIRWHGSMANAGRYLAGCDVFVLSSRTEGTPMVLFEAMAAGVPIVAASVGGVPHVVGPDGAQLVPPQNPRELARGIRALYEEPSLASRFANNASRRLEQEFGAEAWLARHDAIYHQLIQRRSTGLS